MNYPEQCETWLVLFLLPYFHGGTALLKGFSVHSLHSLTVIPLPQFATGTCLAHPLPSLHCSVWAQRKLGYFFSLLWITFYQFFFFFFKKNLWKLLIKEPEQGNNPVQGPLATTSICMGKPILNNFGVVHMWLLYQPWRDAQGDICCKRRNLRVVFALVLSFFYCHAHHVWQEQLCSPSSTLCAALVHLDLDASDFYMVMPWCRSKARKQLRFSDMSFIT